jgi:hypothetical protein
MIAAIVFIRENGFQGATAGGVVGGILVTGTVQYMKITVIWLLLNLLLLTLNIFHLYLRSAMVSVGYRLQFLPEIEQRIDLLCSSHKKNNPLKLHRLAEFIPNYWNDN